MASHKDLAIPTLAPLIIELRTLTVRGKQVTPALLKQFVSRK
jgi:hypothetical protein